MGAHFHVHCIMAAGALAANGARWIDADPRFLFPVRALSTVFRGKFCAALAQADAPGAVPLPEGLAQLRDQLNVILETRETARGLIVNLSDVLFDFDKATLRPGAREKLAKVAGLVVAHPGLMMEVEGHADAIGTDAYNQRLSEDRAESVRSFLVQQGISRDAVSAAAPFE